MIECEQCEFKILLDWVWIVYGCVLINFEINSIKKDYIDKLMVECEVEVKKVRQLKKKQVYKLDFEVLFSWLVNMLMCGRC